MRKSAPGIADWVIDLMTRGQLGCDCHTWECLKLYHANRMYSCFLPNLSLLQLLFSLPSLFNYQRCAMWRQIKPGSVNSDVTEVH